ncbi:DUF317 domain-containing protein [Streptomyces erythrochromogenes]|uniref:DUF317 domain-containing protein n=1 Tax=Streptomyces erythrochromogenes TaxID=285574 RepID=UPI0037FB2012
MTISERQLAVFAADHGNKLGSAVSPRYLAGPGDPRHITHALRAAGWTNTSDPLHPAITMTSPDHGHHLNLDLARPYYSWKISTEFGPGYWSATFSAATPVEVVAGLADALIRPTPHEAAPTVAEILTARGWAHTTDDTGSQILASPDGIVQAELRVSTFLGVRGWEFEAARHHGGYGPEGLLWRAYFDEGTPAHLLASVTGAVSTPEPVLRSRYAINESTHLAVGPEFTIGTEVLAAHKMRLAQARRCRPRPEPPSARTAAPAPPGRTPSRPSR